MKTRLHTAAHRGFTLIESLVAITVLLTAIVAPMTIAYQGIAATNLARDQMIAQYLAQDAAEFIIAKKIENDIKIAQGETIDWKLGFIEECITPRGCYFDTFENLQILWTRCTATCPQLKYNINTHRYERVVDPDQTGKFTRTIVMELLINSNEVRVTVTVNWQSSLGIRSVPLRFNLFNQRKDNVV